MCRSNVFSKRVLIAVVGEWMYVFFFNDTATTEIYTLSLHDALPIWWFLNGELLEGVTSQSIVVSEPGVYTLEVTQNGCTSSVSREFAVTSLVVDFETFATVFPNPTSDKWIIDIKSNNNFNTIRLTDLNGKIILSQSIQEGKRVVLSSTNLRKGIYLLSLIGEDEFTVKRVIKN